MPPELHEQMFRNICTFSFSLILLLLHRFAAVVLVFLNILQSFLLLSAGGRAAGAAEET